MEKIIKLQEKFNLTSFKIKCIAVLSMIIDHYAAIMILGVVGFKNMATLSLSEQIQYTLMRGIGRIAFPIFAFLIVEGFVKTKDRKKYALRMLAFAIISTPTYNIAFGNAFIYMSKFVIAFIFGNVMWTFLLGILMMMVLDKVENTQVQTIFKYISYIAIILIFAFIAETIKCDRKGLGIFSIALFYLFRDSRVKQIISGFLTFFLQGPFSYLGFIPILFYNGQRGKDMRYFFYIFYPLHLLVFAFLRWYLYGIGSFIK